MNLAARAIALCVCAAALTLVIRIPGAIAAIASTQQSEFQRNLNALLERPSDSTETVDFSIGGVRYRVPRNYIISMDSWNGRPQTGVTLRVDTLNFRPQGKDNAPCFARVLKDEPPNCSNINIYIMPPGVATAEAYKNEIAQSPDRNTAPKQGPFGYDVYEIGRTRFYRKDLPDGHMIAFDCTLHPDMMGPCYTRDRLAHNEIVMFGFWSDKLGDAERLEQNIRRLVDSFVTDEGGG